MIKKIVCAALTTVLLISMAVGVAADYTYSTTTQYDTSDSSKIIVTSKVEGVEAGDQLTYLAHRGTTIDDTTVIYADQVVATGSSHTFEYVAEVATDVNAQVLYGGKTAAGKAMAVDSSNTIPGLIKVTINGGNEQYVNAVGDFVEIKYTPERPIRDILVGDEACTWFNSADGFWINTSALTEDEVDLTLEIQAASAVASISLTSATLYDSNKTILALGRATGSDEYGVIISTNDFEGTPIASDEADATSAHVKYEALGSNDEGDFIIRVDYPAALSEDIIYSVKAYNENGADDASKIDLRVVSAGN